MAFEVLCPAHGELMNSYGSYAYTRRRRSNLKNNGVHRGMALGELEGTSCTVSGVIGFCAHTVPN